MTDISSKESNEKVAFSFKLGIKDICVTSLMVAVMCILAPLSVTIGPIPLTLAIATMYLSAYVLGAYKGTIAVFVYILLGLVGLPVFSGYQGGFAKLFSYTGGYIFGYIFLVLVSGLFIDKFSSKKFYFHVFGMLLGLFLCYFFGTCWFCVLTKASFTYALSVCVIPFIGFDIIKLIIAIIVGVPLRRALSKAKLISYKNI